MKTIKYYLDNEALNCNMINHIEITKKQYLSIIKQCEIEINCSQIYETPVKFSKDEDENERIMITTLRYHIGCYDLYLTKVECKKGFCFK